MAAMGLMLQGPLPLARADLPPEAYYGVDLVSAYVPADGAIRGGVSGPAGLDLTLTIVSLAGEEVSGEAVWTGYSFTFYPDEALEPGEYVARVDIYESEPLTVVEATGELPVITESSLLEVPTGTGRAIYCTIYGENADTSALFYEDTVTTPVLELRIGGLYEDQYHYIIQIDGALPQLLTSPLDFQYSFGTPQATSQDEVCFEVQAIPLRGVGGVSLGPKTCLSTTGIDNVYYPGVIYGGGAQPLERLKTCLAPPEGYEEQWCEVFSEAFASQSCDAYSREVRGNCMSARETCEAGDLFGLPEEAETNSCAESSGSKGCSVALGPPASGPNAWYFAGSSLLFAAFGMRRFRSASRRRKAA